MDIALFLSILATLFIVIGLGQPLAERSRLPYSVVLAMVGILLGTGAAVLLRSTLTDALDPLARSILDLPISSQTFLYVFLPTLLFQVSLSLNLRRMLDDWAPILVMAVLAVVLATFAIGAALVPFTEQTLLVCLLVGAIVATTDPSAVVSVFREIGAPQRLTRLVEGESLLNDAAAIALFGLFAALLLPGGAQPVIELQWLVFLAQLSLGGVAGFAVARLLMVLLDLLRAHRMSQVSLTVALPYGAYILAEQVLGVSGVIAVVAAGMTMNLMGPSRMPPGHWGYLRDTWDLLGHWAGSLIFVLAALLVPRLLEDVRWADLLLILLVAAAAFGARAVTLFVVLPLLRMARLSPPISPRFKVVILWGGLRGAITLALALAVTENPAIPPDAQRFVAVLATGFTLFTLLVQGMTLRPLIRWLGLDRLSPIEAALQRQVVAVALQTVREEVSDTARRHELTRSIVRSEAKAFAERLDEAVAAAEEAREVLERDRLTLGLITLAGREREIILEAFRDRLISTALIERMLADAARLIERTRTGGRSEYRATARANTAHGRGYGAAFFLHRVFRISRPLAELIATRFEVLLITRMILRDLHDFVDTKILRIHGRRVTDLLHEVLARREDEIEREIAGMRLQYPGYAERLERGFIAKLALRLEEREFEASHDDGLIGDDLLASLNRSIAERRRALGQRPRLDLQLHKREMVAQFAPFQALSEAQQRRLARALVTIFAEPGEQILRRGSPVRAVYFIASGAVERTIAGHTERLGRGSMFGEIALLSGQRVRRGQVRAITHCTLLRLDEARFVALLRRLPELRSIVCNQAAARGEDLSDTLVGLGLSPPSQVPAPPAPARAPAPQPAANPTGNDGPPAPGQRKDDPAGAKVTKGPDTGASAPHHGQPGSQAARMPPPGPAAGPTTDPQGDHNSAAQALGKGTGAALSPEDKARPDSPRRAASPHTVEDPARSEPG